MNEMCRRVLMTISGVIIVGISVGIFSFSRMGLDPFMVFAHGTWMLTKLDFGTYYVILSAVMLVVIFFVNKHKIGLGTLINLFLIGYVTEFSEWVMNRLIPDPGFATRFVLLIIAIVIMCFASALYFTADMGVSTYDAIAITISERKPKWKFKYIRITTDLICVLIGWSLGATVGIGTIVTAFFMGPLISFFNKTVAEPMRYGKNGKGDKEH